MNYFLFKLSFHTPCHFGTSDSALSLYTSEDHFCADTLFSALCHTARTLYGNSGVEALIEKPKRISCFSPTPCRGAASGTICPARF